MAANIRGSGDHRKVSIIASVKVSLKTMGMWLNMSKTMKDLKKVKKKIFLSEYIQNGFTISY